MFVLHCPNSSWVEQLVELSITLTWSVLESSLCTQPLCPLLGATPLYVACWDGHESCARLLISNGANVDAARNDGKRFVLVLARVALVSCWAFAVDKGGEGCLYCTVRTRRGLSNS